MGYRTTIISGMEVALNQFEIPFHFCPRSRRGCVGWEKECGLEKVLTPPSCGVPFESDLSPRLLPCLWFIWTAWTENLVKNQILSAFNSCLSFTQKCGW